MKTLIVVCLIASALSGCASVIIPGAFHTTAFHAVAACVATVCK